MLGNFLSLATSGHFVQRYDLKAIQYALAE